LNNIINTCKCYEGYEGDNCIYPNHMISKKKLRLDIKTEDTCFVDFIGDTCEAFRINDYACNRNG